MEGMVPKEFGEDAFELPGSRDLLESLQKAGALWTIVTSGTRPLVTGWLEVMGLSQPHNMVTAEDVLRGKPDPSCYRLARSRLLGPKDSSSKMLVFEDAPAGVLAGKAAGFHVVAVATSHTIAQLQKAGADWIVKDLSSIRFEGTTTSGSKQQVRVSISNALI